MQTAWGDMDHSGRRMAEQNSNLAITTPLLCLLNNALS